MFTSGIELKTNAQILKMRQAGLITAQALAAATQAAVPGATTQDVEAEVARVIKENGAKSNFLGYYGFPATACVSVNEEVVHGIPSSRVINDGDVVSIDAGCSVDGWHSDAARTVLVGNVNLEDKNLSDVTEQALWVGIAKFATASRIGEIGAAIDDFNAERYGILEDFVGHGIGSAMHMNPDVLNYRTSSKGPKIKPGMCIAIEPMFVHGTIDTVTMQDDWTIVTADKKRAAHWEHSIARHSQGIWVLTAEDGGAAGLKPFGITPVPLES
ncbi:MAG: type I methionyl aminopeptidase [Micrococcaceae bacterium]